MEDNKNSIEETEHITLVAQGIREMSAKYSKYIDEQVCKFLEKQGYEVEKTKFGMRRIIKKLHNEGKRVELKTKNQALKNKNDGSIEFRFSLEISLREVGK